MKIPPDNIESVLRERAHCNQISLSPGQIEAITAYHALTVKWHEKINITTNTQPEAFVRENIVDPALACMALGFKNDACLRILDVGCGGGFGGIVFKLLCPELLVTLIDSDRKKISFCRQVMCALGLGGCEAHHTRVQDYRPGCLFDRVITRATFSQIEDCQRACQHVLKESGHIVMFRSFSETEDAHQKHQRLLYTIKPEGIKRSLLMLP
ncbi:MAG: 16S rRNA methyltransferase GidB [uncultured bacterium]|nr:MAG: 16S rRNA methyltransferase GidB [uncultured bacterium]HLD45127.1 16S rRNA (guanine(527)-N(7))-methyltransferase RsmG [bacterium]